MNKQFKITAIKKILTTVETTEQVIIQQQATLTCLKRELLLVLEELGDSSGARRKAPKHELSPELRLKLIGGITNVKPLQNL